MNLSVITVTWNNEDEIAEQIRSVRSACNDIEFEQIIVDNDSPDDTVKVIEKNFPEVKLIANKENKGFGTANNQGVEQAEGEFLLFLNPDMKLKEGSLDKIVKWMRDNEDVGIACPKLINEDGSFNEHASPRSFPTVLEQLAIIFKIPHIFPSVLDRYLMTDFDPSKEREVDSVRGSFMLMRREIVEELGWAFDPRYFIWYEDVDICREVKSLGYKVMYTPVIEAVDYVGKSFGQRRGLWKQKNFTESMLKYFKKWEPFYKWIWIAMARPIGIFMVWLQEKIIN
ncbi:MAG: glycosyltransferase family 2 protein [Candidatus Magasanikbacteria bacterium]